MPRVARLTSKVAAPTAAGTHAVSGRTAQGVDATLRAELLSAPLSALSPPLRSPGVALHDVRPTVSAATMHATAGLLVIA
jgi:hypothetical protein